MSSKLYYYFKKLWKFWIFFKKKKITWFSTIQGVSFSGFSCRKLSNLDQFFDIVEYYCRFLQSFFFLPDPCLLVFCGIAVVCHIHLFFVSVKLVYSNHSCQDQMELQLTKKKSKFCPEDIFWLLVRRILQCYYFHYFFVKLKIFSETYRRLRYLPPFWQLYHILL